MRISFSVAPATSRLASVSSMRRYTTPPDWCASRSSMVAPYRPPRWTNPVGLGAKRVTLAPSGRFRAGYRASTSAGVSVTSGNSRSANLR